MRINALSTTLCIVVAVLAAAHFRHTHRRRPSDSSPVGNVESGAMGEAPYRNRRDWHRQSDLQIPADNPKATALPGDSLADVDKRPGDARADTEMMMAKLKNTGPSSGAFEGRAFHVFEAWKTRSRAGSAVDFSEFTCFAGGCSVIASYNGIDAYMQMNTELPVSDEFIGWPGPKFRSGPILDSSGRVKATWILQIQ